MTRYRGLWRLVVTVMAVLLALSGTAAASPLVSDLNAMPLWQGTQQFNATSGVRTLQVDVEYAVYAPGNYGLSADPSGGTEFVYAYQVFNDLLGNAPVSSFSVGLDPTANVASIGSDAGSGTTPGGTAPSMSAFSDSPPTSAVWYFFSNTIGPPLEYSTVLLFTSPYGPQWAPATVMNGGLGNTRDLPSPTPEPATMAFLALGGLGVLLRRKRC